MTHTRDARFLLIATQVAVAWGWMELINISFCGLSDWMDSWISADRSVIFLAYDVQYLLVSPLLFALMIWLVFFREEKRVRRSTFVISFLFDLLIGFLQFSLVVDGFTRFFYELFESELLLGLTGTILTSSAGILVLASLTSVIEARTIPVIMRLFALPGIAAYTAFFLGYQGWPWSVDPEEGIVVPSVGILTNFLLAILIVTIVWLIRERAIRKLVTWLRQSTGNARPE